MSAPVRRVVAQLSELREGRPKLVEVDGEAIVLVRLGKEVCAITNDCPHSGGPFSLGFVRNGIIECPIHLAKFDLHTGCAVKNPRIVARTYPVAVEGDDVILLDAAPEVPSPLAGEG